VRLAVWSPAPSPSGIADYVGRHSGLAREADVCVVVDNENASNSQRPCRGLWRAADTPPRRISTCITLAISAHGYVYRAALSRPAWFSCTSGISTTWSRRDLDETRSPTYLRQMRRAYGEKARPRPADCACAGGHLPSLFL